MSLIRKIWPRKARPVEIRVNSEVYSVAFLPDARHVVGGGQNNVVGHWQVDNGRGVGKPMERLGYLLNVAVSKDGRFIACAGSDGQVEVWDIKTHIKVVQVRAGTASRVFGVDISPDSTRFVAGSGENVAVWSISTGQLLVGPLQHLDFVAAVKFSPDGDRIATATWEKNSIRLYDSSNGQLLVDIPDRVSSPYNTSLAWSNDGRQLFAASHSGKIKCFHLSGSFLSWTEWAVQADNQPQPVSIALASSGKFIAAASSRFITFWDTLTHSQIGPVIEQSQRVWSVALSSNGYLASAGDDKKITLRNLRNTLPRPYFSHHCDAPPEPHTSRTPIIQMDSSVTELQRLETLLGERDKAIQAAEKEKEDLEETIQSLFATLRTHEENLDKLKQEVSSLKTTVQGLRKQLSDAQSTSQSLTKKLRETSEADDQHKLEAERIKAAFDEFKVMHETELAEARKPSLANPVTGPTWRTGGIGIAVFESWMKEHSITANTPFMVETENDPTTDYNAVACSAFVQARSRNWSAAYEDAQQSINIQLSAIGHIARAVAFVGQRDYKAAMRAFALVFRDGDPDENRFMLVIWAVISCLAGEYIDGILRVHDLVHTTEVEKTTHNCVQAYMCILLGKKYMTEGDHESAIRLFKHARASFSSHRSPRLEMISVISGWRFDELEATAQQHLRDAFQATGRAGNVTEP